MPTAFLTRFLCFWLWLLLFLEFGIDFGLESMSSGNTTVRIAILVLLIVLVLGAWCKGEKDEAVSLSAPMEKTEQEALYSAIQGFVGKWWNGSDLYPDPCGWTPIQGVSCDLFDGLWYVTDLNIGPIHDNSLSCAKNVEFRPHLFMLKHLKTLSFFNCFISPRLHPMAIPTANWDTLSNSLESLEFRTNPGLTGQIPTTFGNLRKLQSLVLLENGLSGHLPGNIGNLFHLRRLALSGNLFTGKIPDSFGGLNELLILDLSRNALSGTLPLTFGGLTSLIKLDLSKNKLQGKIPNEIGNLKNLTLLDLSYNKFSGGLTKSIQQMTSLEELVLSNNPIGENLMSIEWNDLYALVILDFSNMGLTGEIPESIAELKNLRFLGLSENNLSGELSSKLAELPSVSALYVNGNNLTGKLKFSEEFYGKMGRRFGAWNNTKLCYPFGAKSAKNCPFGVKPCQQEVTLYEIDLDSNSTLGNLNWNQNFNSMVSLGNYRYGIDGAWSVFLVEALMIVVVLNFAL